MLSQTPAHVALIVTRGNNIQTSLHENLLSMTKEIIQQASFARTRDETVTPYGSQDHLESLHELLQAVKDELEKASNETLDQFYKDIVITAIESGAIEYWAAVTDYQVGDDFDNPQAHGHELETSDPDAGPAADGERFKIDPDLVKKGVAKALEPDFKVNDQIRTWIRTGLDNKDAGNIDQEVSDVIIQAAVFGQIIYG